MYMYIHTLRATGTGERSAELRLLLPGDHSIDSYCRDERVIVEARYCRLYTGLGLKDDYLVSILACMQV